MFDFFSASEIPPSFLRLSLFASLRALLRAVKSTGAHALQRPGDFPAMQSHRTLPPLNCQFLHSWHARHFVACDILKFQGISFSPHGPIEIPVPSRTLPGQGWFEACSSHTRGTLLLAHLLRTTQPKLLTTNECLLSTCSV